jgi:hypothetical protein
MENLFERCYNWQDCENEELKNLFEEKMIKGNKFSWPKEEKLDNLNKICSDCDRALKITEKKCPVCGQIELTGSPLRKWGEEKKFILPLPSIEGGFGSLHFYQCENKDCKRLLYSHKKL